MRAVGYVRVSTDEQAREGCSLDNQEARIRAYSDSQEWELVRIYREEGVSGKAMKRPHLCEMVEDVEAGKVDCILVYRVDRLTRKQKDLWHLLEDIFEANGVGFKSVIEPFDTTTAQGKVVFPRYPTHGSRTWHVSCLTGRRPGHLRPWPSLSGSRQIVAVGTIVGMIRLSYRRSLQFQRSSRIA